MPSLGPMVYRSAHVGAALLVLGVVQFLLGMGWAQYLYPNPPGYSLTGNYISDLGSPGGSTHAVVFNTSIRLLGLCGIIGAYLIRTAFPARRTARLGIAALALAGVSAFAVGTFPEDYMGGTAHGAVSALTFFFSGLALVVLAAAMIRDTRWKGMRTYTFASGIFTWIAMVLFAEGTYLGIGPGGMERLVVAPILLWGILAGAHLLRTPRYSPQAVQTWGSTN
ncbi:MAG TPA: DUF998 domain-containing protein [Thermoplasmata archaeon]|nr:DUF998 domain-containing protein [Thermoplasmata archaeon]